MATVFKVAALVVLVAGILAAVVIGATGSSGAATYMTTTGTDGARVGLAVGVGVGSILYAAVLGFFGYVLDYLRDIRDNTDQLPTTESVS